ncbi:MAG: hypothetical protein ABJE47_14260 [bacterium]
MRRSVRRRATRSAIAACAAGLLWLPLSDAAAQQREIPVQAGVGIDHDTVTVGDVIRLTVRIHAPLGATVNFPAAVDSLGPIQSIEPPTVRNGSDSASAADRVATYRLAAWDIGQQAVRLGEVLVQSDEGERRVALTLPSVFVRSVLPADTALRVPKPARPLLDVRPPIPWWWWAAGALAVLVLGLLAWWLSRRWRRTSAGTGDAYADARVSFGRIERLRLIDAGESGRHAALMTDVLRHYLSARIDEVSLAQTSGELLDAARGAPSVSHEALATLLHEVDAVKFAAAPLGSERARALGEEAKTLVREEHARSAELALAAVAKEERAA